MIWGNRFSISSVLYNYSNHVTHGRTKVRYIQGHASHEIFTIMSRQIRILYWKRYPKVYIFICIYIYIPAIWFNVSVILIKTQYFNFILLIFQGVAQHKRFLYYRVSHACQIKAAVNIAFRSVIYIKAL